MPPCQLWHEQLSKAGLGIGTGGRWTGVINKAPECSDEKTADNRISIRSGEAGIEYNFITL